MGIGSGKFSRSMPWAIASRSNRPRAAPISESSALSTSSCWNRRPRPAPSERRMASSCRRAGTARQKEARNIHAGDEQHQADHHQQHGEEQAHGLHLCLTLEPLHSGNGVDLAAICIFVWLGHRLVRDAGPP